MTLKQTKIKKRNTRPLWKRMRNRSSTLVSSNNLNLSSDCCTFCQLSKCKFSDCCTGLAWDEYARWQMPDWESNWGFATETEPKPVLACSGLSDHLESPFVVHNLHIWSLSLYEPARAWNSWFGQFILYFLCLPFKFLFCVHYGVSHDVESAMTTLVLVVRWPHAVGFITSIEQQCKKVQVHTGRSPSSLRMHN